MPQTPSRLARVAAWLALISMFGVLAVWARRAESIYSTGVGSLGTDAAHFGPRELWPRVAVPNAPATLDAARGETLYKQWCATCHGEKGLGDGVLAKALSPPPRNFSRGRFRLRTTQEGTMPSDADLYRTLTAGILASRMPSFSFLPDADRWALVGFVKQLSAFYDEDEKKNSNYFELLPPGPEVTVAALPTVPDLQAIERGKKLFESKGECWKCHGIDGRGDGPSAETLVAEEGNKLWSANLRRGPAFLKTVAEAKDVVRVLKTGIAGTPMPNYSASFSEAELADIALFAESLWKISERAQPLLSPAGMKLPAAERQTVSVGEQSFLANCAGCHGKIARGDGVAAPWLLPKPAAFAAGVFKRKSTPEGCFPTAADLKQTLREGIAGSSMPAWNLHADSEIDALVAYITDVAGSRARQGDPIPIPAPPRARMATKESVQRGAQVFAAQCTACHGENATGDGPFAPYLTDFRGEKLPPRNLREQPMKAGESPAALFRTIGYGFEGTPMPGFAEAIPEADRWDLIAYILSLRPAAAAAIGGSK